MVLHLSQIAMALRLQIPIAALERHVAASPAVVGAELAQHVHAYVMQHQLGYYPALDYLREQGAVDPDLLTALENISWIACGIARNEIQSKMRPVFAAVRFETVQTQAFGLPSVRPAQATAQTALAEHYTADVVKVSLVAKLIQHFPDPEVAEKIAASMAQRWLKHSFSSVTVSGVKCLEPQ